ncbi:hypothetical protein [Microbacterium sp.]|uniref:hypothetical protein n=1 Tax=Microbacterium sp. TaxID=51671 RepID=UPI002D764FC0|nr:hypothetical protein [Microbacterium sp.]HET6301608.1 hypothetical protein [Microbacterium sp.]
MSGELTPRERAEMRDLVLAGTQRIRPAGRRRSQAIAAAIALVLIGGVSGGAITTAALLGQDASPAPVTTPTENPTPTEAPAPTPTPTPEPPSVGVAPFGGDCANTITDQEADALRGIGMTRSDYRWRTGANDVLGGIDCVWVSDEGYLIATLHLYAYPAEVVPAEVSSAATSGCSQGPQDERLSCTAVGVVDGTWLLVRADAPPEQISAEKVQALYDSAVSRMRDHPRAAPAMRTDAWWAAPDCPELAASVDPAIYGYERVALLDQPQSPDSWPAHPAAIPSLAGAAFACELHFTSGSGDSSTGEVVRVDVVPGGAVAFASAVGAEYARTATVDGAEAAVIVPGLDRYEGSPDVVVATDGVNMLMVSADYIRDPVESVPLTGVIFALISR